MLIEAVPEFYQKIRTNRPSCTRINAAISGAGCHQQQMYVNGQWSGLITSMPDGTVRGHMKRSSKVIHVQTVPLSNHMLECDYLSLDTEGNEISILQQWFKDGGKCRALTVEFNYDSDKYTELCQLCEQYGMLLADVRGFDLCFVKS